MRRMEAKHADEAHITQECVDGRPAREMPLSSEQLLAGGRVRTIRHGDEHYFLRLTRNGKLILCK